MKRAYAFFSLLIISGALRVPAPAQQPTPQSPTITRQSFLAEVLSRRLSPPEMEPMEEPVLRIETAVLRLPDPNAGLGNSRSYLETLSSLYETALFQRQRFRETGQPIEFEHGNLYFRQDRHVVTKGLIFYRLRNDRIDFGVYQRTFHNEASPARAREMRSDPSTRDNNKDDRQYFFGVRFKLSKSRH